MAEQHRSRFNFDVTAQDVEKAHVNDSYKCVVAQAIARQISGARRIEVDVQTIRWSDSNGRHVFLTPYSVAGYIIAFDAGDEIHPFRFQLRNPIQAAQKKATSEAAKAAKTSRNTIRNERRRLETAQSVLADPSAPADKVAAAQVQVEAGPVKVEAAKMAHEDLKAAYQAAGESTGEERITDTARPAPKLSKLKTRAYGHRLMRVNQAEGRKHYA